MWLRYYGARALSKVDTVHSPGIGNPPHPRVGYGVRVRPVERSRGGEWRIYLNGKMIGGRRPTANFTLFARIRVEGGGAGETAGIDGTANI